jgi:hypothetical protein
MEGCRKATRPFQCETDAKTPIPCGKVRGVVRSASLAPILIIQRKEELQMVLAAKTCGSEMAHEWPGWHGAKAEPWRNAKTWMRSSGSRKLGMMRQVTAKRGRGRGLLPILRKRAKASSEGGVRCRRRESPGRGGRVRRLCRICLRVGRCGPGGGRGGVLRFRC